MVNVCLSNYFWAHKIRGLCMKNTYTVGVIPTLFARFEQKYPWIKAASLWVKLIQLYTYFQLHYAVIDS